MRNIWTTRLLTFALWLLAAASAAYWLIQTTARAAPNPVLANATVAGQGKAQPLQPDTLAVAHGLGAIGDGVAAPQVDGAPTVDWNPSRFALSGIVAQGSEKDGLVMISVDGKPAQILQVGATVEPNVVVQALSRQSVTLANISNPDAPVLLTLKLGEQNKTPAHTGSALSKVSGAQAPAFPTVSSAQAGQAPAFPQVSAALAQQAPAFPTISAAQGQALAFPPPAAAAAAEVATPEASAEAEREARRARLAERIEQRRAANANNAANNSTTASPAKPDTPAPRRSVLSDDNLYFGD